MKVEVGLKLQKDCSGTYVKSHYRVLGDLNQRKHLCLLFYEVTLLCPLDYCGDSTSYKVANLVLSAVP